MRVRIACGHFVYRQSKHPATSCPVCDQLRTLAMKLRGAATDLIAADGEMRRVAQPALEAADAYLAELTRRGERLLAAARPGTPLKTTTGYR